MYYKFNDFEKMALCQLVEEDEYNGSYFEVDKHRVSIHVTRPYPEERRKKQSEWAKESGINGINSNSDVLEKSRAACAANGTNATTEIKKEAQSDQD